MNMNMNMKMKDHRIEIRGTLNITSPDNKSALETALDAIIRGYIHIENTSPVSAVWHIGDYLQRTIGTMRVRIKKSTKIVDPD